MLNSVFFIGVVTMLIGVGVMWLGVILQMATESVAKQSDAKMLLAFGMGVLLAGCLFGCVSGMLYPDYEFEAKLAANRLAMEHASELKRHPAIPAIVADAIKMP